MRFNNKRAVRGSRCPGLAVCMPHAADIQDLVSDATITGASYTMIRPTDEHTKFLGD